MKQIGVAVIGCGGISDFHLRSLQEIEKARLIGVFSRSEEKARKTAETYQCAWTTRVEDLLENPEVDLVSIVTSSGSHAKLAKQALTFGKHVFVEKPITMRPEEAAELIQLAQERKLMLSVVSQRRFEEPLQVAKSAVDQGHLGKILLIEARTPYFRTQEYYDSADWRGTIAEDGGALMNQGIHQIDLLLWFGGKVKTVYGKTATMTHRMEAEDLGLALLTFENGGFGTIMSSTSIQPGYPSGIRIYGEKGSIELDGGAVISWNVPGVPQPSSSELSTGGASSPLSISHENHKKQLENVLNALESGAAPLVTGEDGRRAVELIHAVYESSRTGQEIVVP